jgi:hypothetical protein
MRTRIAFPDFEVFPSDYIRKPAQKQKRCSAPGSKAVIIRCAQQDLPVFGWGLSGGIACRKEGRWS